MTISWARIHHPAGTLIFSEGDPGEDAYLIESGAIQITYRADGQERRIATLRAGEMFGEIALFDKLSRTATATAAEDTVLIPISWDLILRKLKHSDPLLSHLLEVVISRFRNVREGHEQGPAPVQEDGARHLRDFAVGQLKTAQDLSDALDKHQFQLHYQPVVRLRDGSLAGFEALIRWNRPGMGLVPPHDFIGVAEDTGLIVPIGRWVIGKAIAALAMFQAAMDAHRPGSAPLFMSINLSAQQLQEWDEVNRISEAILATGVDPHRIVLEITESALIDNPQMAVQALRKLKDIGVQLAIDDFGTGYSSLNYLGQFPLDTLKIALDFVTTMAENLNSRRITRAVAGLARDLEMDCIAEGIETAEIMTQLRAMGCEYGQGFYFSRPRDEANTLAAIAEPERSA